jgi:hypothetical protein
MVEFAELATVVVVTVKVALVAPAATVTVAGTEAVPPDADSVITAPLAGAGPFNITVPVALTPPTNVVGLSDKLLRTAGLMVSVLL